MGEAHPTNMRYQLLAVDIDGTLVNSRDELTPATREAIGRATAAGIHVVLATGRRYARSRQFVQSLGLDVPLVTASGALVKDPITHKTLYRAEFDPRALRALLRLLARHGHDPIVNGDTHTEGFDFYYTCEAASRAELAEYLEVNAGLGRLWPDMVENPPPDLYAGFVIGRLNEMLELETTIQENVPGALSTHVMRSPRYSGYLCEFSPAGATKWSAVRRLADAWTIPVEAICAVGDDVNDIPMIRAAGLGVAMGNAVPPVKAVADRIAPSHDDDGLVDVVEWLLGEEW